VVEQGGGSGQARRVIEWDGRESQRPTDLDPEEVIFRDDALLETHPDDPRPIALLDQRVLPLVREHREVETDGVGAAVLPLQVHHALRIANELQQPAALVRAEEKLCAALALGLVDHARLDLHERFLSARRTRCEQTQSAVIARFMALRCKEGGRRALKPSGFEATNRRRARARTCAPGPAPPPSWPPSACDSIW
jgi:hypothetical protein